MATKKTIQKTIKWLLEQDNCKGKASLRFALWRNTIDTKFKKGDCVCFSFPGSFVWDHRVENFRGTIKEILYGDRMYDKIEGVNNSTYGYMYQIECVVFDGKTKDTQIYNITNKEQDRLMKKVRVSRENYIRHPDSENCSVQSCIGW